MSIVSNWTLTKNITPIVLVAVDTIIIDIQA